MNRFSLRPPRAMQCLLRIAFLVAVSMLAARAAIAADASLTLIPREVVVITDNKVVVTTDNMAISADGQDRAEGLVLLRFSTHALPLNATVTRAQLRLVLNKAEMEGDQTIRAYSLPDVDRQADDVLKRLLGSFWPEPNAVAATLGAGSTFFGAANPDRRLQKNTAVVWPGDAKSLVMRSDANGVTNVSILLWGSGGGNRTWYSIAEGTSARRPRLTLTYTLPQTAAAPASAQSDGRPAARSARAFLPTPYSATSSDVRWTLSPVVPTSYSRAPAFFNERIYVLTDTGSGKSLDMLSPLGGVRRSLATLQDAGQHLAVSPAGRLYVVGSQRIVVYQLSGDSAASIADQPVQDLEPAAAPAIGADGSLYFVNGQQVYGLNPDLQELWKVSLGSTVASRVTVGPSGEFVYVASATDGLVAINAQTGEPTALLLNNLKAQPVTMQAPVVARLPDGTEKIYVAADSFGSGVLAAFDNVKTQSSRTGNEAIVAPSTWPALTGLFSQPILDANAAGTSRTVYAIRVDGQGQARLSAFDWVSGKESASPKAFAVGTSGPYLLAGGDAVIDAKGGVYAWNGDGANANLYGFDTALASAIDAAMRDLSPTTRLFFGTEGTLYAQSEKDGALWAILPQYTLAENGGATEIFSPTHLRVDGTAGGAKPYVLSTSGNVLFAPGFAVRSGTTLRVTTNMPAP